MIEIISKLYKRQKEAIAVVTKPIDWANLFGGPGTIFSLSPKLGTINLVTTNAIGLILGPDNVLAKNPYVRKKQK